MLSPTQPFKTPHLSLSIKTQNGAPKLTIMGCKIDPSTTLLFQITTKKSHFTTKIRTRNNIALSTLFPNQAQKPQQNPSSNDSYKNNIVTFKTLGSCKLGISKYPDFVYNAHGGFGTGTCAKIEETYNGELNDDVLMVDFDVESIYIPPLTSETTRFLGLPLPPFLKIDVLPQLFHGTIDQQSGKIDLEFKAMFLFSIGTIYRAPPLLVKTVLTTDESVGKERNGRGEKLNKEGKCRLVGVATVDPIDDFFMNTFLSLPTECLAVLNATIDFSRSPDAESV